MSSARLLRALTSTWTLGVLAAAASWNVAFSPPTVGLDPSWLAALYMAAHHGMEFGSQIVFTYGPLGFLTQPGLWYSDLAVLAFLYEGVLHIVLCISLVWALRRTVNAVIALILTVLVLIAAPAMDVSITLTAIWCLAALSPSAPPYAWKLVLFGGAALGALETLIELRTGPVIWAMCAIALLAHERSRRRVPVFIGCSVVGFMSLWFAAGQGVGNLLDFARNSAQIVSGYSEAMGLPSTPGRLAASILLGVTLVAAAALSSGAGRPRLAAAAVIAVTSFSLFKEAVVRADAGHTTILFATAAGLGAAMAFDRRRLLAVAAVAGLAVLSITSLPKGTPVDFNPVTHARQSVDQVNVLLSPARREQLRLIGSLHMINQYRLTPATLGLLKGHTVHIDPVEAGVAWAYGLKWDPAPVFQSYSAYTATLDRLNAAAVSGPAGPQRILRESNALRSDNRFPGWDPPAEQLATLCNYVPLQAPSVRWLVLGKVPERCGMPQLLGYINTRYGETVSLPSAKAGGVLYAKIQGVAVSGWERLGTFLYRAKLRHALVNATTYGLVPGTAADGLIMDVSPNVDYPAPFYLSPLASTIKLTGSSGALRLDVYWMPVRSPAL